MRFILSNSKIQTQKYILYDSIYIRFKKRQNYLMVIVLRIVFTSCEGRYRLGRDTREPSRVLEMGFVLTLHM